MSIPEYGTVHPTAEDRALACIPLARYPEGAANAIEEAHVSGTNALQAPYRLYPLIAPKKRYRSCAMRTMSGVDAC